MNNNNNNNESGQGPSRQHERNFQDMHAFANDFIASSDYVDGHHTYLAELHLEPYMRSQVSSAEDTRDDRRDRINRELAQVENPSQLDLAQAQREYCEERKECTDLVKSILDHSGVIHDNPEMDVLYNDALIRREMGWNAYKEASDRFMHVESASHPENVDNDSAQVSSEEQSVEENAENSGNNTNEAADNNNGSRIGNDNINGSSNGKDNNNGSGSGSDNNNGSGSGSDNNNGSGSGNDDDGGNEVAEANTSDNGSSEENNSNNQDRSGSLIDEYADTSTEMPSYMDPEDG